MFLPNGNDVTISSDFQISIITQDALVEFVPILRLAVGLCPEYERPTGQGGRTVDWSIPVDGIPVLVEVKRRDLDLIEEMKRVADGEREHDGTAPQPTHDHGRLFRNVEQKYLPMDPSAQLQGVWVVPGLQQEEAEFDQAFRALDYTLVHFAILGGMESGLHILTLRDEDLVKLRRVFPQVTGGSSVFERGQRGGGG